jgi:hypothetical protein
MQPNAPVANVEGKCSFEWRLLENLNPIDSASIPQIT